MVGKKPNRRPMRLGVKGQATTELAIMGSVILMALLFLAQQGFMYNARQGLEMYTFRQALQMSKDKGRGISLTTMRDVFAPSFFAGLSRQRIMASSSVELNPWDLYVPQVDDDHTQDQALNDVGSYQLLQVGDGMLKNGYFIRVSPTLIKVDSDDGGDKWTWTTSSIRELDASAPINPVHGPQRVSTYAHTRDSSETESEKISSKTLDTEDKIPTQVTFEEAGRIRDDYLNNDWEGKINSVEIREIPQNSIIQLEEEITREKGITTPHAAR